MLSRRRNRHARHTRHTSEIWRRETRASGCSRRREGKAAGWRKGEAVGGDGRHSVGAGGEGGHGGHAATPGRWWKALGKLAGRSSRHTGEWRRDAAGEAKGRKSLAGLVLKKHRVRMGLALGSVRRSNRVNNGLGLFVADLLVIVYDVA